MTSTVWSMDIALPEAHRSAGFGKRKPCARVLFDSGSGQTRELDVPVRVARVLENEPLSFPMDYSACLESVERISDQVCMTVLTEMLSRRDHSVHEVREKLGLYGFSSSTIEDVIKRALSHKFLNDQRFADFFIESRKRKGWGRRKIELELKRKGVEPEAVVGYPDAYFDSGEDLMRARELLAKKRVPETRPYEKLVRFLMSKGFEYSIASTVVKERLDCSSLEEGCSVSVF